MRHRIVRILISIAVFVTAGNLFAQKHVDAVSKGNAAYYNQDYVSALKQYRIASTSIPESPEIDYNIGSALFQKGKYEEAIEKYESALNSEDAALESHAQYNLGDTYFRMGDFQKAIQSFQKALELNPSDLDAKYNLELSRRRLKEEMSNEQKDEKQQEQEKQEKKEEQEQQEKQDKQDQNKNEENKDKQQEQKQDQQDQEKKDDQKQDQQQQQQEQQQMSKEDAERILNALKDDEKDIQKKIKRYRPSGNYTGKDW